MPHFSAGNSMQISTCRRPHHRDELHAGAYTAKSNTNPTNTRTNCVGKSFFAYLTLSQQKLTQQAALQNHCATRTVSGSTTAYRARCSTGISRATPYVLTKRRAALTWRQQADAVGQLVSVEVEILERGAARQGRSEPGTEERDVSTGHLIAGA
eukprot:802064-Rhodomonas_salina.4